MGNAHLIVCRLGLVRSTGTPLPGQHQGMIHGIDLDHVALATELPEEGYARYAADLGGRWGNGGDTDGFTSYQMVFANEMRVEIISPFNVERNDFMRRFIDRNGRGPHHLTFKVGDLPAALETVRRAGFQPVGVDLSNPWWQEAFLHPKDAPGVVIQLVHSQEGDGAEGDSDWFKPEPADFPAPKTTTASLVHVAHAVADLPAALDLFAGVLGGQPHAEGEDGGVQWADLRWPGPGRIRLLAATPAETPGAAHVAAWLDGRAGRIHHLAFAGVDPATIPGAEPGTPTGGGDPIWSVPPEANQGTRLLCCLEPALFRHRPTG